MPPPRHYALDSTLVSLIPTSTRPSPTAHPDRSLDSTPYTALLDYKTADRQLGLLDIYSGPEPLDSESYGHPTPVHTPMLDPAHTPTLDLAHTPTSDPALTPARRRITLARLGPHVCARARRLCPPLSFSCGTDEVPVRKSQDEKYSERTDEHWPNSNADGYSYYTIFQDRRSERNREKRLPGKHPSTSKSNSNGSSPHGNDGGSGGPENGR
ncbi:uncharacterized protein TRAVEDRAFT_68969 [Trametes versicolor FP-101664 SS1]|uniref:uncharacterized protein n=1 Tax=Trametes versicolor (strain FP-101664) TaxID=717944 RepID=UPI0004622B54|nr:uncharacterized protein TRAVEDRAFT_68969 [Trametes versicolor FP-101664 SS1]EIW62608.1 hypothetical protein TRAVEDRAFT_68969 [Trametes versicolor FP-101664 SS1]